MDLNLIVAIGTSTVSVCGAVYGGWWLRSKVSKIEKDITRNEDDIKLHAKEIAKLDVTNETVSALKKTCDQLRVSLKENVDTLHIELKDKVDEKLWRVECNHIQLTMSELKEQSKSILDYLKTIAESQNDLSQTVAVLGSKHEK